jgi:hypothetical protein
MMRRKNYYEEYDKVEEICNSNDDEQREGESPARRTVGLAWFHEVKSVSGLVLAWLVASHCHLYCDAVCRMRDEAKEQELPLC